MSRGNYQVTISKVSAYCMIMIVVFLLGYLGGVVLNGFGFSDHTLWDVIDLAVIPFTLALGAWWLNRGERSAERDLAAERSREEALQEYLDRMSELLLQHNLKDQRVDGAVRQARTVARARTLTTLRRLDGRRKAIVIQFLFESDLIERDNPPRAAVEDSLLPLSRFDDPNGMNRLSILRSLYGSVVAHGPIVSLRNADLNGVDLERANLRYSEFEFAEMRRANLSRASLAGAALNQANLEGGDLREADLTNAHMACVVLRGADLRGADLHGANLHLADLRDARLDGARMWNAQLLDCRLEGASLIDVDFEGAHGITSEQIASTKSIDGARNLKIHAP